MTSVGPLHSTRLYYRPTPLLREVVAACSALARPFRPTPWAVNRHLQLALLAFADGRVQLAEIRRQVPESPLYGVGVSAGSGLLVRALGEDGDATPFTAGIASCPGYDTTRAFGRVHRPYDRYLTRMLKAHFLERHADVLRGHAA